MKTIRNVEAQKVIELHYHRNGITGLGFYVGIVKSGKEKMLVVRFPGLEDEGVVCAAFDLKLLAEGNIKFGENSFRGDYFHKVMDEAIAEKEAS